MRWNLAFRVREAYRGSLWVLPVIGAIAGALLGILFVQVDAVVALPPLWTYSSGSATALLTTIFGASVSLTGFVVTVSILVVQMATGTFSARVMRLWYRDRILKWVLALLVATMTLSFQTLRSVESDFVPDLGVWVSGILMSLDVILFVLFLDHFLHRLRPVAVAANVAQMCRDSVEASRRLADRPDPPALTYARYQPDVPPTAIVTAPMAGAIQAVDLDGLTRFAHAEGCTLVLPHVVGDFVTSGGRLVEVYGPVAPARARRLQDMVALGTERTIEQDPAFAIRVMVDIAARALSAAVNDPTTAVQILDHLGDVLERIGREPGIVEFKPDAPGHPVVVMRTRPWEEILTLGVTEIRLYGRGAVQVMRRLRAVLEVLQDTVDPANRPAVEEQLRKLDITVRMDFADTPDLALAMTADRQGLGGLTG